MTEGKLLSQLFPVGGWAGTGVVIKILLSYLIRFYIYLILIFHCTQGVGGGGGGAGGERAGLYYQLFSRAVTEGKLFQLFPVVGWAGTGLKEDGRREGRAGLLLSSSSHSAVYFAGL